MQAANASCGLVNWNRYCIGQLLLTIAAPVLRVRTGFGLRRSSVGDMQRDRRTRWPAHQIGWRLLVVLAAVAAHQGCVATPICIPGPCATGSADEGDRPPASVSPGLGDAGLGDAGLGDAGLGDAGLGDAGLGDAGLDDATPIDASAPDQGAGHGDAEPDAADGGMDDGDSAVGVDGAQVDAGIETS